MRGSPRASRSRPRRPLSTVNVARASRRFISPRTSFSRAYATSQAPVASRRQMDEFGVRSHHLAHEPTEKGYFTSQIMPIDVPVEGNGHTELFKKDEGIRANANYDATAALQPAFNPEHSITAGNSSQISDGAAAVLL